MNFNRDNFSGERTADICNVSHFASPNGIRKDSLIERSLCQRYRSRMCCYDDCRLLVVKMPLSTHMERYRLQISLSRQAFERKTIPSVSGCCVTHDTERNKTKKIGIRGV